MARRRPAGGEVTPMARVTMYTTAVCPYCQQAERLLASRGVASIDKDLVNVSKVLKMGTWTKITKLVLPSALPLIFTLRIL